MGNRGSDNQESLLPAVPIFVRYGAHIGSVPHPVAYFPLYVRVPPTPATPATDGSSQRSVRQEKISLRCRRFQGTYLPRGDIPGSSRGGREGVSSHCGNEGPPTEGKVCPLPTTHNPAPQGPCHKGRCHVILHPVECARGPGVFVCRVEGWRIWVKRQEKNPIRT